MKITILRGPMGEAEKDWWLTADLVKKEYRETIAAKERKLKRDPNHPDRPALLRDIEDARHDLWRLDEVYRDEVIERVCSPEPTRQRSGIRRSRNVAERTQDNLIQVHAQSGIHRANRG
jgi:hypothetical protein